MTIDQYKNLKEHLYTQIEASKRIDSRWVYILREEAMKCYILADAQETLVADPVHPDVKKEGSEWWYVCGECQTGVNKGDRFCHECGRRIMWE